MTILYNIFCSSCQLLWSWVLSVKQLVSKETKVEKTNKGDCRRSPLLFTDKNMAECAFTYTNGTKFEFDKFRPDVNYRIYVGQPAKIVGRHTGTVLVYVAKTVFDFDQAARRSYRTALRNAQTAPIIDATHPAITAQKMAIGVPEGVYVPLRWNVAASRFEIYLEGLENDKLILEDSLASEETKKKVNQVETDDEPAAVAVG